MVQDDKAFDFLQNELDNISKKISEWAVNNTNIQQKIAKLEEHHAESDVCITNNLFWKINNTFFGI